MLRGVKWNDMHVVVKPYIPLTPTKPSKEQAKEVIDEQSEKVLDSDNIRQTKVSDKTGIEGGEISDNADNNVEVSRDTERGESKEGETPTNVSTPVGGAIPPVLNNSIDPPLPTHTHQSYVPETPFDAEGKPVTRSLANELDGLDNKGSRVFNDTAVSEEQDPLENSNDDIVASFGEEINDTLEIARDNLFKALEQEHVRRNSMTEDELKRGIEENRRGRKRDLTSPNTGAPNPKIQEIKKMEEDLASNNFFVHQSKKTKQLMKKAAAAAAPSKQ